MQCLYEAGTTSKSLLERCPLREVKNVQFLSSWDQNSVRLWKAFCIRDSTVYLFCEHDEL